jgi:hypothetical protein
MVVGMALIRAEVARGKNPVLEEEFVLVLRVASYL